ncbi:toMV resistant protein Tm-2 netted virescent-like [Capsicum chacoense]
MQLSYDNLPDHIRPCFLYIGMFPEDARISVSKLISLWIAEGFMQNIESGRLMEEVTERYLMDLIHSNMVMVSKRRYNGKVKYCHVHVHDNLTRITSFERTVFVIEESAISVFAGLPSPQCLKLVDLVYKS